MIMIKKILPVLGIIFVGLILLSIVVVSMGGARRSVVTNIENPLASPGMEKQFGGTEETSAEGTVRLVIRTGTINMVVKDITDSVKSIVQYAENKGGWVVSSNITEAEQIPRGSVSVRVPAEIFDEAMAYFKGLAEKVSYEATQGKDVTEEYVDLQSRLRNLEAAESQLLRIMERSGTIPDVLAVQRELTSTRNQIEQTKGRMQYLEQSAEMATISLNLALSEELLPIPSAEKWRPVYVARQAWNSLLASLRAISYLLIWIIVFAVIWIPLGIIGIVVFVVWKTGEIWKRIKEILRI